MSSYGESILSLMGKTSHSSQFWLGFGLRGGPSRKPCECDELYSDAGDFWVRNCLHCNIPVHSLSCIDHRAWLASFTSDNRWYYIHEACQ